jgi:hypothetical protein
VASRHNAFVGKQVLVSFKTTHIDRAGETASQVGRLGEIVAVDASGWVVADTAAGEHIRCPLSKPYRRAGRGSAGTTDQPGLHRSEGINPRFSLGETLGDSAMA